MRSNSRGGSRDVGEPPTKVLTLIEIFRLFFIGNARSEFVTRALATYGFP